MQRLQGILFYTLRGVPGWSDLQRCKVDVAKVVKMSYRKRAFCLFQRDYPYTLKIDYYKPETSTRVVPVVTGNGLVLTRETLIEHAITKRYRNRNAVLDDYQAIRRLQAKLDNYQTQLQPKLLAINEAIAPKKRPRRSVRRRRRSRKHKTHQHANQHQ